MRIEIISLFPELMAAFQQYSIVKRAAENDYIQLGVTNPRDFTANKHRHVDDTPYGGGPGMLMQAEPIFSAVEAVLPDRSERDRVILLSPTGATLTQAKAKELAGYERLVLICGHYEGVDHRVEEYLADETVSIGDYVLTGGEVAAMVVTEAVIRMIPGVLGAVGGAQEDSFYEPLLEYPQYTKPAIFRGYQVPEVLLSGHHAQIAAWRRREALRRTYRQRPDLLKQLSLSESERDMLRRMEEEE